MSGEHGAPAHDEGGGSITGAANERTALLAAAPRSHHYQHQNLYDAGHETESDDGDCGERLDAHDSELLLARTASISSAVGLAPEAASEGAMFQHRLQKQRSSGSLFPPATPGYDVEEGAPLLGTAAVADKSERQYLINTNFRRFVTIFAAIMLGSFLSIFDGTIMASSHPV